MNNRAATPASVRQRIRQFTNQVLASGALARSEPEYRADSPLWLSSEDPPRPLPGEQWRFDANDAVMLLTGKREECFQFERVINLFLLLVWLLWPDDTNKLEETARLLATRVTFTKVGSDGQPVQGSQRNLMSVRERFADFSFKNFYVNFVLRLGGLDPQKNTFSRRALTELIVTRLKELRLGLDVVRYLLEAATYDGAIATRKACKNCLSENLYNVADNYGVRRAEKRSKNPYVISPNTVDRDINRAPRTIVFLYCLRHILPQLMSLDLDAEEFLVEISAVAEDVDALNKVFMFYAAAISKLTSGTKLRVVRKWAVINAPIATDVPVAIGEIELPTFSPERIARVLSILETRGT